ncbi:MAG: biopolymer transporter ExbD [Pirellulales bacterium]
MPVAIKKGKALDLFNLTPMIDMVFLLLIFFLVSSEFAKDDAKEMPVDLPSASSALPMTAKPKVIYINVTSTGQFVVDEQLLSSKELESVLARAVRDNPLGQSAIIRADKQVAYQHVMGAMDACVKTQINYSLAAKGEE